MEDTINERLKIIIQLLGVSQADFCRATTIDTSHLAQLLYSTKTLSTTILKKILDGYPDINLEYIIDGRGDPFIPADQILGRIRSTYDRVKPVELIGQIEQEIRDCYKKIESNRVILKLLLDASKAHDQVNSEGKLEEKKLKTATRSATNKTK